MESARIARGKISPLSSLKATDYNGVVFPGGFGAAKNLYVQYIILSCIIISLYKTTPI